MRCRFPRTTCPTRPTVPRAGSVSFDGSDRRYEPYVRAVPHTVERAAEAWDWRGWSIHVEHVGDPAAAVRMLLVHGAGGNAAAMWPIAAHLAAAGARVTVLDLPGYGRTRPAWQRAVRYEDWQHLLVDAVRRVDDGRPLILVGASIGGMLALDAAALSRRGDLVVATCLLDVTDARVRRAIVRAPWMGSLAGPLLRLVAGPLRWVPLPMRWISPMERISNSPGLAAEVLRDARGGRNAMPLGWYRSFLQRGPAVPAERYAGPPVLLAHPAEDRWTPTELSAAYLRRLPVPTRLVELTGCGHFPVEEPGFQQLLDVVGAEIARLRERA